MALNLDAPESQSREQRLGSITGYVGTFTDLTRKGCSGCLTNRKRCLSTASSCAHIHAMNQLAGINDAVVIDHGPLGCSAGMIGFAGIRNRTSSEDPGFLKQRHVVSTNLNEFDTVFGATDKLRKAIQAAYDRYHPRVMYVLTSCVSSIIGDDVFGVTQEMTQELGIPVGFAAAEGIKTKIWASGFDAYCHAVANTLLKAPEQKKTNVINYIGFMKIGRKKIDPLFARLGLEVNYLTGNSSVDDFARASEALGSFIQCGSQGSYLAGALEQLFGVKFFQSHPPYGGIGFERFFREIGAYVGQPEVAEEVILEQRTKYAAELERYRSILKGKRALIALGGTYAFEYIRMLHEFGVEVVHTVAYHYDPKLDNQSDEPIAPVADVQELGLEGEVSVNDIQQYETYLAVKKYHPDFVLSRAHGASPWAVKTGVPAIEAQIGIQIFGYEGLVNLGRMITNELRNQNFVRKFAQWYESPFTDAFENKDPFSYLLEGELAR